MPSNINQSALDDVREQMNKLFKNMFVFTNEDMQLYDACFSNVFSGGITFSYMTATFYAQFAGEILVGMLSSNPFRRFLTTALDEEAKREGRGKYWHESMATKRFGLPGVDYTADMEDLKSMMNTSYMKIESLSNWYGTDEGRSEFDLYCLSNKAIRDIKRVIMEFPYLIRRYDFDQQFAGEIMEYAGIVAAQIKEAVEGENKQ